MDSLHDIVTCRRWRLAALMKRSSSTCCDGVVAVETEEGLLKPSANQIWHEWQVNVMNTSSSDRSTSKHKLTLTSRYASLYIMSTIILEIRR